MLPIALADGLGFVAVVLAYWILDVLIRRDAVGRLLKRGSFVTAFWVVATLALATTFRWTHIPHAHVIMPIAWGLSLMLTWKVTTLDTDPVIPRSHWAARLALLAAAIAIYWTPACLLLVVVLLTRPFDLWRHHTLMPMRGLLATTAFALLSGPSFLVFGSRWQLDVHAIVALVLLYHVSNYFTAGISKRALGPKWHSWIFDNRLHHMVTSSYSWGWARFVSWPMWSKLVNIVKWAERPLQAIVFFLEFAAPLALLSPQIAIGFCVVWSIFHVGVFALSGILFWEWIGANMALAWTLHLLPEPLAASFFGWHAVVFGVVFIMLFPMRYRLWEPVFLGWWDAPFTQRMHWEIAGKSGKVYAIYPAYMCPNTRLYGMAYGSFLAPVPLIAYKIGLVFQPAQRDAIRRAGPDPARLDDLRARFGALPRDAKLAENHIAYLHRFLHAINQGKRRLFLPRYLRWLKAPADHYYDWGDWPAFRGQEPAVKCSLRFREEYFDGSRLVRLRNDVVAELVIDEDSGKHVCGPEPKARDMEHFLVRALHEAHERQPTTAK